jgi:hypothetical protein
LAGSETQNTFLNEEVRMDSLVLKIVLDSAWLATREGKRTFVSFLSCLINDLSEENNAELSSTSFFVRERLSEDEKVDFVSFFQTLIGNLATKEEIKSFSESPFVTSTLGYRLSKGHEEILSLFRKEKQV